jgi:hypothetical protein
VDVGVGTKGADGLHREQQQQGISCWNENELAGPPGECRGAESDSDDQHELLWLCRQNPGVDGGTETGMPRQSSLRSSTLAPR